MREDYPIFVKWAAVTDWIMDTAERFPKSARFTLTSRIVNLALDTLESIIEAIYAKNRRHILAQLNLQLEKLRVLFRISYQRRYMSMRQYEYISAALNETGRMAGGWMKVS